MTNIENPSDEERRGRIRRLRRDKKKMRRKTERRKEKNTKR